jgi:hypothetical protein
MRIVSPTVRRRSRALAACLSCAVALPLAAISLTGCGSDSGSEPFAPVVVEGASRSINGATVKTWAKVTGTDVPVEVGVTVPMALIANPPAEMGDGPAGSLATLDFPAAVKANTFFDHFEIQWEPHGHEPERYEHAHFDMHVYGIPVGDVLAIQGPDTAPPAADRIPAGYAYPSIFASVPQMGVHAASVAEFAPGAPEFDLSMILGYWHGSQTFVEPMVTQEALLAKRSFSMDVPRPATLGRKTLYPGKFRASYDAATDSYTLVFSDFVMTAK